MIQDHRGARRHRLLHQLSHKSLNQFWWNLVWYWDLLIWWTLYQYSFYLVRSIFKKESCWHDFVNKQTNKTNKKNTNKQTKTFNVGLHLWHPFKLGLMIDAINLYSLISAVWKILTFIQGHIWLKKQKKNKKQKTKNKKTVLILSQISEFMWMKFCKLLQPVGLLKFMLNLFHMINIQEREFYLSDFIKSTFNNGLCSDANEVVCFKLGMMLDPTKSAVWHQCEQQPWP